MTNSLVQLVSFSVGCLIGPWLFFKWLDWKERRKS
jgi:hypothetical protein